MDHCRLQALLLELEDWEAAATAACHPVAVRERLTRAVVAAVATAVGVLVTVALVLAAIGARFLENRLVVEHPPRRHWYLAQRRTQ